MARSWATQVDLMERYPEHRFACSSAQQFKWLEQVCLHTSIPPMTVFNFCSHSSTHRYSKKSKKKFLMGDSTPSVVRGWRTTRICPRAKLWFDNSYSASGISKRDSGSGVILLGCLIRLVSLGRCLSLFVEQVCNLLSAVEAKCDC